MSFNSPPTSKAMPTPPARRPQGPPPSKPAPTYPVPVKVPPVRSGTDTKALPVPSRPVPPSKPSPVFNRASPEPISGELNRQSVPDRSAPSVQRAPAPVPSVSSSGRPLSRPPPRPVPSRPAPGAAKPVTQRPVPSRPPPVTAEPPTGRRSPGVPQPPSTTSPSPTTSPVNFQPTPTGSASQAKSSNQSDLEKMGAKDIDDLIPIYALHQTMDKWRSFIREARGIMTNQLFSAENHRESGGSLAVVMRDFGRSLDRLSSGPSESKGEEVDVHAREKKNLAQCVLHAGEIPQLVDGSLQNSLNQSVRKSIDFFNGVDKSLSEMAEKKRLIDENVSLLNSLNEKVDKANAKGRGVNLVKLAELRRDRDAQNRKTRKLAVEVSDTFEDWNDCRIFEILSHFADLVEGFWQYFHQGSQILDGIAPRISSWKNLSEKKKVDFRSRKKIQIYSEEEAKKKQKELLENTEASSRVKALETQSVEVRKWFEDDEVYVDNLQWAVRKYLGEILKDGALFAEIYKEDVEKIFCNIEAIGSFHSRKFFPDVAGASNPEDMISVYVRNAHLIRDLYLVYIDNYCSAQQALDDCTRKSKIFSTLLQSIMTKEPHRPELASILTLPLKRLPHYLEFFKSLKKGGTLSKDTPLYQDLIAIIDELEFINECAVDSNYMLDVASISESIQRWEIVPPFSKRRFLMEGSLVQAETCADYHFFLFNDILLQTKKQSFSGLKSSKKYIYANSVPVNSLSVCSHPEDSVALTIGELGVFTAESSSKLDEWLQAFKDASKWLYDNRYFAVDLTELMSRKCEKGNLVPLLVEKTCKHIEDECITEEGIFRLSGSASEIEELRARVDEVGVSRAGADYTKKSPHVVSGLLKLFIRSLPCPVIPYQYFDDFLKVASVRDPGQLVSSLKVAINSLPKYHKYLLERLILLLTRVDSQNKVNKMQAFNLSIVFGPHFLAKKDASPFDVSDSKSVYCIIQHMIEKYKDIFSDVCSERDLLLLAVQKKRKGQLEIKPDVFGQKSAPDEYFRNMGLGDSLVEDSFDEDLEDSAEVTWRATISLKEIVKQGKLVKKGAMRKSWKERWFVLKKNYLFYFKTPKDQTPRGVIKLRLCTVAISDLKPFCFSIKGPGREYFITAGCDRERDEWIAAVSSCVET